MKEIPEHIMAAMERYINDLATPEDIRLIEDWDNRSDAGEDMPEWMTEELPEQLEKLHKRILARIAMERGTLPGRRKRVLVMRVAGVAATCLLLLAAGVLWRSSYRTQQPEVAGRQYNGIDAGGKNAVLELADGRRLLLHQEGLGQIAHAGGMAIQKTEKGAIAYTQELQHEKGQAAIPEMNTIRVPEGGEYRVTLCDGTVVCMNAATTLRFPSFFTGKTRELQLLAGEIYLEVAPKAGQPFEVQVGADAAERVRIQVLGTRFNVKAYPDDEAIATTLVEGRVRIHALEAGRESAAVDLREGWQALAVAGNIETVAVDMQEVLAWQKGMFELNGSLEEIMKQVKRWYKVEVVFNRKVPWRFIASMPRSEPVSRLLQLLEATGKVHFEVTGKRITVL